METGAHAQEAFETIYPSLEYYRYRVADQSWSITPAVIAFHDVSYVVDGAARYRVGEETVTVGRGDLVYIPPGTYREAALTPEGRFEVCAMNFALHTADRQPVARLPFETVRQIGVHPELISLYKSLSTTWLLQEPGFRLMARAYVELILSKLLDLAVYQNPVSVADLRVRQVIEYITARYDQPVTLRELAELVYLSPSYLSALFHKSMGMKLSRYINMIRVNHAETLLMNNMCNVTEASEVCGFCDVYYFSRVFTEMKGYTPREIIGKRAGSSGLLPT